LEKKYCLMHYKLKVIFKKYHRTKCEPESTHKMIWYDRKASCRRVCDLRSNDSQDKIIEDVSSRVFGHVQGHCPSNSPSHLTLPLFYTLTSTFCSFKLLTFIIDIKFNSWLAQPKKKKNLNFRSNKLTRIK